MEHLCECGCGGEVTIYKGKPRRFISGHNNRGKKYYESQQLPKLCHCGCGEYASAGKLFIRGHSSRGRKYSNEHKVRMSKLHSNLSAKTRKKMSEAAKGRHFSQSTRNKISKALTGIKRSEETIAKIADASRNVSELTKEKRRVTWRKNAKENGLKISIGKIKCSVDGYCDIWADREYRDSLRGSVCKECGITNMLHISLYGCSLSNHHIDGDRTNCHPNNFTTLCKVCHAKADWYLVKIGKVKR